MTSAVDAMAYQTRDVLEVMQQEAGLELTTLHLSSADIASKAGTNRIEPLGKLAVRPIVEGYPVKKDIPRPSLNIDISVQVTDDKNNVVKTTKRVPVT